MSNITSQTFLHKAKLRWLAHLLLACAWLGCEDFEPPPQTAAPTAAHDAAAGEPSAPHDASAPPIATAVDASIATQTLQPGSVPTVASRSHVFVANPREREIVAIHAQTLQAKHVPCAAGAALLAAAESADLALALAPDSRTGCALDLTAETPRSTALSILAHANRIVLSPDSRHALVFHDRASARRNGQPQRDTVEVSVVRLASPARSATLLVGLHPREAAFNTDGTVAFVVSDAGVSVLPLSAAASGELVQAPAAAWQSGPFPADATVRLAVDGARALAFERDGSALQLLDLATGESRSIDLALRDVLGAAQLDAGFDSAPARIADAVLDRAGTRAFVALRGEQRVLELPLPAALDPAHTITVHALPGQPTDRLALSGGDEDALLVLSDTDARATLWSVNAPDASVRVPLLERPTDVSADAAGLVFVLAHGSDGAAASGYSVVRVRDGLARSSQSEGGAYLLTRSEQAGVLAVLKNAVEEDAASLDLVDLQTLALAELPLEGEVVAAGLVNAGRHAFVQLDHPDGRLHLLDLSDGSGRTTSGFLIAHRVQE